MAMLDKIVAEFMILQDEICSGLEALDGEACFEEDAWNREQGGGGRTRIIRNGNVFERGGVNFSHVYGPLPAKIAGKFDLKPGIRFDATGVSIVIHPESPKVPIIHMNIRYFQMEGGAWWFGGGIDLTPIYIVPETAGNFHRQLKATCERFDPEYYPKFKLWCDNYFYLKHRDETRGVGGIFFDQLQDAGKQQDLFDFTLAVGKTFIPAYAEVVTKHMDEDWNQREKQFQLLRRSRYVEFNLLYDKGTKFGLDTGGRVESILMSMPPMAAWEYCYEPEAGSAEAFTLAHLRPVDWMEY